MNLVIVESPGKVKTITKYLNDNLPLTKKHGKFIVMASVGHIRDLLKNELSIDIDNNFEPIYEFSNDKRKIVEALKKCVKQCSNVFIASDNDKEGEFIAESIRVALDLGQKYMRIVFTEISANALQYAIEHPNKIDQHQLDAQVTRRTLDRLVGFKLSPLLWTHFKTPKNVHLSAGRVQSALLHLIIDREQEIKNFQSKQYWSYIGTFKLVEIDTTLENVKLCGQNGTIVKENLEKCVHSFLKGLQNSYMVRDIKTRETTKKPEPPFITSSLQQESSFSVKRTMHLAQELYEAGHITYMRTDSFNMSEVFKTEAREFVLAKYGNKFLGDFSDSKKTKSIKGAQEAHECIRPVQISNADVDMSLDHNTLYQLIRKRTIAFFMKKCVYDELEIRFADASFYPRDDLNFVASFKKVKFNGFLKVYDVKNDVYDFAQLEQTKQITCGQIIAKNTWQSPPARFNESGLVKLMEQEAIGRPSTYATMIQKIADKQYVSRESPVGMEKNVKHIVYEPSPKKLIREEIGIMNIGQERNVFVPQETGVQIDTFLKEHFNYIIDKQFTSIMESELDKIAEGTKKKIDVLKAFWSPFLKDLLKKQTATKLSPKISLKPDEKTISYKKIDYVITTTRYGPALRSMSNGETRFIDLGHYLKYVKKQVNDLDIDDIKFLTKLPHKVSDNDVILMGKFGLYLKHNEQNIKLPFKTIMEFIKTQRIDLDSLAL